MGSRLQDKLQVLSRETKLIKEVRGKGLMIAIEFNGADDQPAATIHDLLFKKGYIVSLRRGQNTLRIDPPLNDGSVPDDLLQEMIDESYELILASLSKKARQEILQEN